MAFKESPLNGMSTGTAATVAIRELPGLHSIDLRVAPGTAAHSAVAERLGIDISKKQGQMIGNDNSYVLRLAPDWWLIVGLPDTEQKLESLRDDHHFSVVDVSGQRTTIELEGPNARDLLAHLWEQDLRDKSFPVASVSQGLMAKAPVIVCHIAPLRYRIMVRSSFALHLWKALADAATELI